MKPYCRNNSNFTFREICCGPPLYNNDCCCDDKHNCNCKNNHNEDCCNCNKHICSCPQPKPEKKDKDPYICLPIKKHPNGCSPFMYVMIGYMIGMGCDCDLIDK